MKNRFSVLLGIILICACLLIPIVGATDLKAEHVTSYSFDAPAGQVIYQIYVDQLPMGVGQAHTLTVGSATYYLEIESSNPNSIYYNFDISLTFPNGTVQNVQKSMVWLPGAGYRVIIQPVFIQAESKTPQWAVDLMIGTSNTSIKAAINTDPEGWTAYDAIPFTGAQGTFSNTVTNVYLYTMTNADFQRHANMYDPNQGLGQLGSSVVQWGWESILGFVNRIPILGPQFVSLLTILGAIVQELILWLVWILRNLPTVIAGTEVTICILAVVFAGKKPKPDRVAKNIFNYNVAVFRGFIWIFDLVFTWLRSFVELIAHLVQALKPL